MTLGFQIKIEFFFSVVTILRLRFVFPRTVIDVIGVELYVVVVREEFRMEF